MPIANPFDSELNVVDYRILDGGGPDENLQVNDFHNPNPTLPAAPVDGDDYIATSTFNGWTDTYIYTWNASLVQWVETVPVDGYTVFDQTGNKYYTYNGTVWVYTEAYMTMIKLKDTPVSYMGAAGKYTVVNGTETGVEFGSLAASGIANTPAGGIAATNVQDAINELDGEKASSVDESKIIYVGKHGLDTNDGLQIQKAFLTFGAAITAASYGDVIHCADDGIYAENLTGKAGVSISAPSATLQGVHTITAANAWSFGEIITDSNTVGIIFNSAGNDCSITANHYIINGVATTYGLYVIAGNMNVHLQKTTIANGYLFPSATGGNVSGYIGDVKITGVGYVIGVTGVGTVRVVASSVDDGGSGTGHLLRMSGLACVTLTSTYIRIGTLSNISVGPIANIICNELAGTASQDGAGSATILVAGDVVRIPTTDEKAALAGTGTPAAGNKYVTQTDADINGGNIDGTIIGAATPAAGTFTDVVATNMSTDVAAAGLTMAGNSIVADGTDANIDIDIIPKGTGEVNLPKVDIDAGTIDGATIATSDITVGAGKTLDVSAGTLTLANDQISGDKINGGTATPTTLTATTVNGTTVNATTLDTNVTAAGVTLSGTTLEADGTDADISVNIKPKGAGFINADTSLISNVTDPVSDQDAATKKYVVDTVAGVDEFTELTDTPANYTGSGGKYPRVNATPDALEFVTPTASEITNVAAGAIVAVTVQAAIDELDTDKANKTVPGTTGDFATLSATGDLVDSGVSPADYEAADTAQGLITSHDHSGTTNGPKLTQANSHESPDTDNAAGSLHHTVGTGANNAASGADGRFPTAD